MKPSRPPLRIGAHVSQHLPSEDVNIAVRAEQLGFDAVWLGDGIWSPSGLEATVLWPAMLQATSRITVGVNVFGVPIRYPQSLARISATLEAMYPGRAVLGLGAGYHKRFAAQEAWG